MIRVLVVDDHPLVRAGLASLLASADDIELVGEGADGSEAERLVGELAPDLVLMDLSMPEVGGVEATRRIRGLDDPPAVVILTSSQGTEGVAEALAAGADGYLLKDSEPQVIFDAIRSAAAGHAPIDPRVARALLPGTAPTDAGLSAREADVLRLIAQGLPNKQIAQRLGIAERTVKVHVGSLFRRIGVADRTSAALWAQRNGY